MAKAKKPAEVSETLVKALDTLADMSTSPAQETFTWSVFVRFKHATDRFEFTGTRHQVKTLLTDINDHGYIKEEAKGFSLWGSEEFQAATAVIKEMV